MSIVGGILVGAAAMYFLDPKAGRRRRAQTRDRLNHFLNVAEDSITRVMDDAGNRSQGAMARTRRFLTPEEIIDDRRLEGRVRSTLGRLTSTPSAVTAETSNGVVTLLGTVPEDELGYVITGIRRVRGVQRVESRLTTVARLPRGPKGTPAPRPGGVPDLLHQRISPTGRAVIGATGLTLVFAGARRGGGWGLVSAAMGGLLVARALTETPSRLLPVGGGSEGVQVQKSILVQRPTREVFAFWSNFRNFPQFMRHIREVRETESGISHWVADGPAGVPVSWDAEITGLKPHQWLAWKSLDGSTVMNEGEVRFEEVDEGAATRIHVRMIYSPPGGVMGHAVATLFGANPKHQLDDDLLRLKMLLESGAAEAAAQPGAIRTATSDSTPVT